MPAAGLLGLSWLATCSAAGQLAPLSQFGPLSRFGRLLVSVCVIGSVGRFLHAAWLTGSCRYAEDILHIEVGIGGKGGGYTAYHILWLAAACLWSCAQTPPASLIPWASLYLS